MYIRTLQILEKERELHGKVIVSYEAMRIFMVHYKVFQFMCGANVIVDICIV